jgi:hypothetical protein
MFRESLNPSSPHAFALVTPGGANGVAFQRRIVGSDVSVHTPGDVVAAPVWVRLTRRGASITAAWSFDGQTWSRSVRTSCRWRATIYVGLAVTSHDAGSIATATFDNVRVARMRLIHGPARTSGPWVRAAGWSRLMIRSPSQRAVRDIWGTEDAFRFTYRAVSGNFDVTARVANLEEVDQWTKAGVHDPRIDRRRERACVGVRHAERGPTASRSSAVRSRVRRPCTPPVRARTGRVDTALTRGERDQRVVSRDDLGCLDRNRQ